MWIYHSCGRSAGLKGMGLEFGVFVENSVFAYLWTSDYHVIASIIDEIPRHRKPGRVAQHFDLSIFCSLG